MQALLLVRDPGKGGERCALKHGEGLGGSSLKIGVRAEKSMLVQN